MKLQNIVMTTGVLSILSLGALVKVADSAEERITYTSSGISKKVSKIVNSGGYYEEIYEPSEAVKEAAKKLEWDSIKTFRDEDGYLRAKLK